MRYVLGIDQGGTKTAAAVADEHGRIIGAGWSAGACHSIEGMDTAMKLVREAANKALQAARCNVEDLDVVYAGMTGADWPHEYDLLQSELSRLFPRPDVVVDNDCMIALRSGTNRPNAAVLCAGTGFNAAARNALGERYVYGYYVNDEDSGGEALGRLAMKAVFNAESGLGPPTRLTEAILVRCQAADTDELMKLYTTRQLGRYKTLAPLVFETAIAGDDEANRLVEQFGTRLARYAACAAQKLSMTQQEIDVVVTGSIFKNRCPSFHDAVERHIRQHLPLAAIVRPRYEPVVGAILAGLDRLRNSIMPIDALAFAHSTTKDALTQQGDSIL